MGSVYKFKQPERPAQLGKVAERKHPAVVSVCAVASAQLLDGMRQLFARADDLLFEMAESAKVAEDRRDHMDAMRALRLAEIKVNSGFAKALDAAFGSPAQAKAAGPVDGALELKPNADVEEAIAISNMEQRASARYSAAVWEVSRRLEKLSAEAPGEIHEDSLAPKTIVNAFIAATAEVEMDFQVRLIVYKLFDRVVLERLGEVYDTAIRDLAEHGVGPRPTQIYNPIHAAGPQSAEDMARQAARAHAPAPSMASGAAGAASQGIVVPADLYSYLASYAARQPIAGAPLFAQRGDDVALAAEMFAVLERRRHGRDSRGSWLPVENLAAVAAAFESLTADEGLGEYGRAALYRLLVPALRTAAADAVFFVDPQHPMRALIREAYQLLIGANGERERVQEAEKQLSELASGMQLRDIEFGRTAPLAGDEQVRAFVGEAERMVAERLMQKSTRSRAIAVQRVRQAVDLYEPPDDAVKALVSGMGPALALAYLQGGLDGSQWSEMCQLLDDLCAGYAQQSPDLPATIQKFEQVLAKMGISAERVREVVSPFRSSTLPTRGASAVGSLDPDSIAFLDSGAKAPAAPAPALKAILRPQCWFQVHDHGSNRSYYLTLTGYLPGQDRVMFRNFSGQTCYTSAAQFAADLARGVSYPVETDELVQDALRLLRASGIQSQPFSEALVWNRSS